ncbi:hypothetical protein, partial [Burkholderia vietnamiensis]|uniref:hypothetical protein n=1 Tax=Burkholderia vietnamiensis TaxID=60552 RepID=UPI001E4D93C0
MLRIAFAVCDASALTVALRVRTRGRTAPRRGSLRAARPPPRIPYRPIDFNAGTEHDGRSDRIGRADRGRQIRWFA